MTRNRHIETSLVWDSATAPLLALARRTGLGMSPRASVCSEISQLADQLGIDLQPVLVARADLARFASTGPPAVLQLDDSSERFLALLACRFGRAALLTPGGRIVRVPTKELARLVSPGAESQPAIDLGLGKRIQDRFRAFAAVHAEDKGMQAWIVRADPGRQLRKSAGELRLAPALALLIATSLLQQGLMVGAWAAIAQILLGRAFTGLFALLACCLVSIIPARLASAYASRTLALNSAVLLKRRLLLGASRMDLDEAKSSGTSGYLSKVIEAEAISTEGLRSFYLGASAIAEILAGAILLTLGAGGIPHALIFVGWIVLLGWFTVRYYQVRKEWTSLRIAMTGDVVENLTGHRTRLALGSADDHDEEDVRLADYLAMGQRLNDAALALESLRRSWIYVGMIVMAPHLLWPTATLGAIAVSMGGVLIGHRGIISWVNGTAGLAAALASWTEINRFWGAASQAPIDKEELPLGEAEPVLAAGDLAYSYPPRRVLRGVSLRLASQERVLLTGPTGSGKSTLAAVLAGLRSPSAGAMWLRGTRADFVRVTTWRKRVVVVPQFHQNHLFAGSLAYNVLMGRAWPPDRSDLEEAANLLGALGLGDLLGRMPNGLHQLVGETGWRLSHGERTRVFLARGILQRPDVLILDESLAGLDPDTLLETTRALQAIPGAVVLIAHP